MTDTIAKLKAASDALAFNDTMAVIDALYDFTPTAFTNGNIENEAGQNNASCKLFSFAQLHHLTEAETLVCFGQYYRGVIATPDGDDHQNIRNFMQSGWAGFQFGGAALTKK